MYEQILNKKLKEIGFMPGRGAGDAVFILRRLTEKYQSKGKKLFYKYVHLKKVVDRVPQKVAWYAFRKRGVTEYLVQIRLHSGFKTAVSVDSEFSDFFFAQVKVHQGSMLSPLFLVIVMDALTESVRDGSLLELLMKIILFCVVNQLKT